MRDIYKLREGYLGVGLGGVGGWIGGGRGGEGKGRRVERRVEGCLGEFGE